MEKIRIGEQIRLLRRKNDVTQDQLAGHLGVTPQAVSRWESGVCYPDMGSLPAIADFFSVSMDELLCYADRRTEKRVQDCIGQVDTLLEAERVPEALELLTAQCCDEAILRGEERPTARRIEKLGLEWARLGVRSRADAGGENGRE